VLIPGRHPAGPDTVLTADGIRGREASQAVSARIRGGRDLSEMHFAFSHAVNRIRRAVALRCSLSSDVVKNVCCRFRNGKDEGFIKNNERP
jgi:hypothetical protein